MTIKHDGHAKVHSLCLSTILSHCFLLPKCFESSWAPNMMPLKACPVKCCAPVAACRIWIASNGSLAQAQSMGVCNDGPPVDMKTITLQTQVSNGLGVAPSSPQNSPGDFSGASGQYCWHSEKSARDVEPRTNRHLTTSICPTQKHHHCLHFSAEQDGWGATKNSRMVDDIPLVAESNHVKSSEKQGINRPSGLAPLLPTKACFLDHL